MFPLPPLTPLPSRASETDKNILAPAVQALIDAANALHARLVAVEPAAAPVAVVPITALQDAALDGVTAGQVIELRSGTMLTRLLVRSRVLITAPAPAPGVPQISLSTTSIDGGQIDEGETTPVTGSIDVTSIEGATGFGVSAVTYTQGSSGWLTPTWDGVNTEVDWSVDPTGLIPGNYAANFDVTSTNAESVTVTAILTIVDVPDPPGAFDPPQFSMPTYATHDPNTDDIDGDPYTPEALGYYA